MAPVAAKSIGGVLHAISRRVLLGVALAVLSFMVYAGTVFVLPQVRDARYCCEQSSVAAAISNAIYRAPLGTLYSGVFDYFIERFSEPLEQALEEAQVPGVGLAATPAGELFKTTRDGNGVGYVLVATAAFRLFGLHAWGLTLTMLILMALSAAAFLYRFSGGAFVTMVTLYFSVLTIMLFTPMTSDPSYAVNIPVAGIRYYSLLSILPIFHILFEFLDPHALQPATGTRNSVLLGLQTVILVLVMLVRGSALPLIGAIALVWLALAWRHRGNPNRRRALYGNLAVMGLASVGVLTAIAVSVPRNYLTEGRFGTVIWQRVTESLGVNPAFPFPGVNDMFDCRKYVPQGIESGMLDTNGICIWFDYISKHNIPIETISDKTFGDRYETALREAFFNIAARYPSDVLQTFFYYKPRWIVWSIAQSMKINLSGDQAMALLPTGPKLVPYPPLALGLLLVSLGIGLAPFILRPVTMPELRRIAGVTLLSALFTIPSYLAAWAMPHTSADLLFYCLFAVGLVLGAMLIKLRRILQPPTQACAS